jgi:ribonuclease T2
LQDDAALTAMAVGTSSNLRKAAAAGLAALCLAVLASSGAAQDADMPGDFDFYVLALSWSPGFCETGGAFKAREQCASGAHLGFVVHGLWPQYWHGYPSDCGGVSSPSWLALQTVKGLYPDLGLARFEWRKHGTCSGKSPSDYFADVRKARASVTIPPPFGAADKMQTWTPLDVQRAFIAVNPRLRPGMLAIECTGADLVEVRICFSKDLHDFVACPEVARHFCYTQQISVPPMR